MSRPPMTHHQGSWLVVLTIAMGCATLSRADTPTRGAGEPAMTSGASHKTVRFHPGDSLVLVLRDSSRVLGVFVDLGRDSLEKYRDRYDAWRRTSSEGAGLPELEAQVELVNPGKITGEGRVTFCGLGHEGVEVRRGHGAIQTVEFSRFSWMVESGGKKVESSHLRELSLNGEAPLLTMIEVSTADGTRAIPFDDVLAVESASHPGLIGMRESKFTGVPTSKSIGAIMVGGFWANDPSDQGLVARSVFARISPSFSRPRLGLDFAYGFILDESGEGGGFEFDLALCGTIPLGSAVGLAPRLGVGVLLGAGLGLTNTTIGTGAMLRLSRSFGLRVDYTYHRLNGCTNCNYQAISSFEVGPYFGY